MTTIRKILCCVPLLAACDQPISPIAEIPSPDGRLRAVVFTSHGGNATSSLHTSVSIVPDGEAPGWPPNTFTALHRDEGSPQGPFFGPSITVRWVDARTLEIAYDPRASALRRNEEVGGVRVRYVVTPQQHRPSRGLPEGEGEGDVPVISPDEDTGEEGREPVDGG
jgi:hypothetical protein